MMELAADDEEEAMFSVLGGLYCMTITNDHHHMPLPKESLVDMWYVDIINVRRRYFIFPINFGGVRHRSRTVVDKKRWSIVYYIYFL